MHTASSLEELILRMPKAELHMHIEGSLEPELLVELAARNGVRLRHATAEAWRRAHEFENVQAFLDLYCEGARVLRTADDFCDQPVPSAMATLEEALPFGDRIVAVGLDSAERGHPPSDFADVFARARAAGLRAVAHAGEEGPPAYIRQALHVLRAARIDHGVRCKEDPDLVAELAARHRALGLTQEEIVCLARSSFEASFLDESRKHQLIRELEAAVTALPHTLSPRSSQEG